MAMNRMQFQPGLSLPAFLEQYGTETVCRGAVLLARWSNWFACSRCTAMAHSTFVRGGVAY